VLDARRCISYLTIELRGFIPHDLRAPMGNWVFGCDVCQAVCPYNRIALPPASNRAIPDVDRVAPRLAELLTLDETAFRARFRGTAILRAKRRGLVRNACVAAGNSGDRSLVPVLAHLLSDAEPLVRGHAAWALGRLGGASARRALAATRRSEADPVVQHELAAALDGA
jgi:epoxyqueuosine reductase